MMNRGTVYPYVAGFVAAFRMVTTVSAWSYTGPDFNGDGKTDLAFICEDKGGISVHIGLSTGSEFCASSWLDQFESFSPTDRFFCGDFNGDGKTDLAALREDGGEMSCDVFVSNGSAFSPASWAARSGAFLYTDKWFKGDFDGDGRIDLARGYHTGADRNIDLYFTRGSGFSGPRPGGTVTGGFHADDVWLTGDFNRDGKTDIAVVEAGEQVTIRVHLSTGSSFTASTWAVAGEHGSRLASMKWVAEDFSGDGRTDIAKVWNDHGKVSMDVHRSTGDAFVQESWLKQSGDFVREWKWFVADGNGDGAADIMCLREGDGQVQMERFQSTGVSFSSVPVIRSGAAYRDLNAYLVGDFNGDGGSDVVAAWAEGAHWKSRDISGGASAGSVSSYPLGLYPSVGSPGEPIWGDDFLNTHQIRGAVPVGTDLQAVLDAGNDLFLVKNGIYNVSSTLKYRTSYQRIETHHPTVLSENAVLRMQIDQGDYDTLIDGNKQSFVHLANVTMDGNKYALGPRYRAPGAGQGAMVFFSHAEGVWLKRCVMYNTRTWSTCHMVESGASHSHIAEHNYILGAGVDPRGNGMDLGEQVTGDNPTWADGFSISATNTVCRDNFIMDTTDVGVVLFGAPGSRVQNNMIVSYSRGTHGGINLVDATPERYLDDVTVFGATMERYDYRGTVIEENRISAAGARIMIGIPFGRRCWANRDPTVFDQLGGAIRNNRLEGGAFGYGLVLDYVVNVNVSGNVSTASHSGKGVGTPENDNDPDPATAFLWDPDHVTGPVQSGFTDNTKPIEDLLWHHGQPTTADGFFYYPYTPETAEATTRASYWEMLGRQPTSQELADGQRAFLADDRLYGDAFKRQLMQRAEFIDKFGEVLPKNLHVFRTARWRDRLLARDAEAVIQSGTYPDPRDIYDLAHADMAFQLTGADAEITAISPSLPTSLGQGETAVVSVTVKNTGGAAWVNTVGEPARFALASVGDDTAFGLTRVYVPYGTKIAPGQTHTFDLVFAAPPVAYAGEGAPATTSFPCNFRMMQETRGFFGESMTKHLGSTHQVAVENADPPPPDPFYDAAFVSQKILGRPQRPVIPPGSEVAVEITMLNCGNETSIPWSKDLSELPFSLGSENPRDNRFWGTNRISLKPGEEVKPGQLATFVAKLSVPKESGTYPFQWQMISATPGASWFGAKTPDLEIGVRSGAPALLNDHAVASRSSVPARVLAREPFTASFTFTNEGDTPWTAEEGYRLGEVETLVDRTTGGAGSVTAQYADAAAGNDAAHLFDNQVRTRYYADHASAWIRYRFAQEERHVITSYAMAAVDSYGPGPELLPEPSFEKGGKDWDQINDPMCVSPDDARTGSHALKCEAIPFAHASKSARMLDVPIVEGKTYDLSLWYKVPSLTSGNIRIDTVDEYDDQFAEKKIQLLTPEWTQLTGRFTATDSTVSIRFFSKGFDGTCYIDDVSLTEVDAGSDASDPGSWTLAGSNDGSSWTTVDTRSGIEFNTRGLRRQFDVHRPGAYAQYQLTASNQTGNALQFAEVELLTDEGIWTSGNRADLPGGTRITPGQSHTFTLNIDAPARPGTYFLQTRMVNGKGEWFGEPSPKHAIIVLE